MSHSSTTSQDEIELLKQQIGNLKLQIDEIQSSSCDRAEVVDLQEKVNRIRVFTIILTVLLPIKIIVIAIQSIRLAKYINKKKPLQRFQISRATSRNEQKKVNLSEVTIKLSELEGDESRSRTLTPKSMQGLLDEFQMDLKNELRVMSMGKSELSLNDELRIAGGI